MANMREIRTRMKSIQDILKITNAMYLISSSKLKKARRSLAKTEPYFEKLQATISDILTHSDDFKHVYFDQRSKIADKDKKRGYIVVTADKGMAGAYNHNVIKLAEEQIEKHLENSYLFVVGQIGLRYFIKKNVNIDKDFLYSAEDPTLYRARSIEEQMIEKFLNKELDEVYVIYTDTITPVKAETRMIQILPLQRKRFEELGEDKYYHMATFSPSPEKVMDRLVPNYVKGLLYGTLVEAFCSEQNDRMVAMQGATESAKEMIQNLSLLYNRARQAAITQEITEIVSGAKSLKRK